MIDKTYFVPKVTQTTTSQEQIYPQSTKPVERAENTKIGDLTDFEVISDGDTPF